jgi:hypothetical protein
MNREGRTRKAALCIVALAVAAACLAFAFIHPAASTVRQDLAVSHDAPGPVELPVPDDGTVAQGTAPVFATELCHSSWLTIEAPRPGVQRTRCTLVEPNQ